MPVYGITGIDIPYERNDLKFGVGKGHLLILST